ncbi:MAG: glycosyltransferase [Rhodocyclaceae bacterium]|nr:glycosyltransferase [Rhodocyclaceae bacterium]
MMQNPMVTIAVPVYCGEKFIKAAIDSVLAQTFRDFELLVVDNDSGDGTMDIVRAYRDPRIIYVRNETNIGAEENWNKCLSLARGRYIKLLPHDDILDEDCLNDQVKVLESDVDKRLSFVFCARHVISDKGNVITTRRLGAGVQGVFSANFLKTLCIRRGTNLVGEPGAVLFRSESARQVGYFSGKIPYVIDLDYWFRLLEYGDAFYIDKPLSSFRVSKGSWSVEIGAKQSSEFCRFIDHVSHSGGVNIAWTDRFSGMCAAKLNEVARRVFYRFIVR